VLQKVTGMAERGRVSTRGKKRLEKIIRTATAPKHIVQSCDEEALVGETFCLAIFRRRLWEATLARS
jgi:hypothetical protein